jgi:hypothetical protein
VVRTAFVIAGPVALTIDPVPLFPVTATVLIVKALLFVSMDLLVRV